MAIRVGQLTIQYVADPSTESDVRITRAFAQVIIPAVGATIVNVAQTIFNAASDNRVEQAGPDYFLSLSNTIFDAAADNLWEYNPVVNKAVGHQLFGVAGDTTAIALYREVSQNLFSRNIASPDESRDVTQYLGFTDRRIINVNQTMFVEIPLSGISPVKVSEAEIATCFNLIFDGSLANVVIQSYNISNTFSFTQTIIEQYDLDIDQDLSFSQTLDTSSNTWSRDDSPAPSTGFLRQSISISVDNNDCRSEEYDPIIGTGPNDVYEEFAIAPPSLSAASNVILTYPAEGAVTDTLTLEIPEFGNNEINSFTRIDRTTRGGDRKIYSDPKWAAWERLTMEIVGIGCGGSPSLQDIVDFLNTTLGKEIRFVDWENREYKGIIVAPETEIFEQVDGLSLQLVFEGELTSYEVQYDEFDVIHGVGVDVIYEV